MNGSMKYKDEQKENPLLVKQELFEAALDEFSRKSFHEASLNDILKAVKINKGSFYHRFYDKTDLYLCMMERIACDKMEYMRGRVTGTEEASDFFEQIRRMTMAGLEYACHEKRYYGFWRNYLAESEELKNTVKNSFPGFGDDFLEQLVREAVSSGRLPAGLESGFVCKTISIFFYHLDAFLTDQTEEKEILSIVEQFICFLKHGLSGHE